MKFCILLSFFLTTLLWSQEKREKPLPKALFSIMLWNTQGSQDLAYAPWGNENEGNATIVPFTVSYGMPSRKCSFYGDGELNVLRQKEPHEFKEGENPYESVAKIRLPFSAEKPSDSLILLTPSAEEETWKTRNLSFDEKAIPKGHFTFSSQLNSLGRHPFWSIQVHAFPQDGDGQSHPQGQGKRSHGAFGLPP